MNKIQILDCTLRDGGYVNNWRFDTNTSLSVMNGLYDCGVRIIEIGIIGDGGEPGKSTKFSDSSQMEVLLTHRKEDCKYAVMVTQAEFPTFSFPERSNKTVDIVRLAFFKSDLPNVFVSASKLIAKGYEVFLQAMATFMYTDQELEQLLINVNAIKPAAFYIVDSFSTMYPHDVRQRSDLVLGKLDESIGFGFHAHNNIQLAFANVIEFLATKTNRLLLADASIFGMGRGAGNVPLELVLDYCNKKLRTTYNISKVLDVYQTYIQPIFDEESWGYSMKYYLTATKNTNSVYGWYLSKRGFSDLHDFEAILDQLPDNTRYTLKKETVEEIISRYKQERIN